MSVAIQCVAVRGVGLIHIVVPVVGLHHGWIMYIGKVPVAPLTPVGDGGVVVGVGGSRIGRESAGTGGK